MGLKPRAKRKKETGMKTRPTDASVLGFIDGVADERRREECMTLVEMMTELSGEKPVMWGDSIVGFGTYHYVYASGREGDWPRTGFSPRKSAMSVYCMPGLGRYPKLLGKLGKHKAAVSCLYIKRLDDVDLDVLRQIVKTSLDEMDRMYPR